MTNGSSLQRCVSCGAETVPAHLGGLRVKVRPLGSRRGTVAEPRVCPKCGRVDFICANPDVFGHAAPSEQMARQRSDDKS